MLRNFRKETEETRDRLFDVMRQTLPLKQFRASILLRAIYLSLTEKRLRETKDLTEKRKQIAEFDKIKKEIEGGINLFEESIYKRRKAYSASKRALP